MPTNRQHDFSREVRRLTDRRGVDVVVERVGSDTKDKSLATLAPGGRVVNCGATTGRQATLDLWRLLIRELTVLGSYGATRADGLAVLGLVRDGRLTPVIDQRFPLAEAAAARGPWAIPLTRAGRSPLEGVEGVSSGRTGPAIKPAIHSANSTVEHTVNSCYKAIYVWI